MSRRTSKHRSPSPQKPINAGASNRTSRSKIVFAGVGLLAAVIGAVHSSMLAWVCDDAFISFRYAKHFIEGYGLVFNIGEKVEGYTNFLWTILVALGMKLSFDPVIFSLALGVICFVSTIALFIYLGWKLQSASAESVLFFPMTALALSIHHDANVYATSGLETSLITLLVSATFAVLLLGRSYRSNLGAGVLLAFAMMTRPDAILFFIAAILYALLVKQKRIAAVFALSLPVIVLYLPYWIWRYNYYGFIFPNTYYAKSADLTYYSQGLVYFWTYIHSYYIFLLVPVLVAVFVWNNRHRLSQFFPVSIDQNNTAFRAVILGLLFAGIHIAYVIRLGGDYMFARFFIPITPLLFFVIEALGVLLFQRRSVILFGFVILGTLLYFNLFEDNSRAGMIANEPDYYPLSEWPSIKHLGESLHTIIEGLPVHVAFAGTYDRVVYYMDPPVAIEIVTGLTDTAIAHQHLGSRGRPGHEKKADPDYYRKRGVHFLFNHDYGVPGAMNQMDLLGIPIQILSYDNAIMDHLALFDGVHFAKIPPMIDNYIAKLHSEGASFSKDEVWNDYKMLSFYYFDINHDTQDEQRRQAILDFLQSPDRH